jgi:hypothetical protein
MRSKVIRHLIKVLGFTFEVRYITCSKKECRGCPHGPYLYIKKREGKKVRSIYLGKADPQKLERREEFLEKLSKLMLEYEEEKARIERDFKAKLLALVREVSEEGLGLPDLQQTEL